MYLKGIHNMYVCSLLKGGICEMAGWGSWVALVGGVLAVIGQWFATTWLPVVGGVVAVVGALGAMSSK